MSAEASAPLRIALYNGDLPEAGRKPGGVAVFVDRLAAAMARRGHEVTVFTFSAPPPQAGYRVRRLRPHGASTSKLLRQYVAPWLLNDLPLEGFDVLHLHGDDWFYLRRRLPTVRTFHGSALFESRHATSLRRRLDKRLVFPLELAAGRMATRSYAVGVDAEVLYRTDGRLPLGIDPPATEPRPTPHPSILFIGTWDGRKRGSMLHRVFREQVRARIPEAELLMISDFCEPAEGVTWIETPSDAELADVLSRAWVFCLPSEYEGFGIPYLEAMAAGVPVVASPNLGARTLLCEGRCGRLAKDEDLGPSLVELLGDEGQLQALAGEGRVRAAEFSWSHIGALHEHAYREAMTAWKGKR